jgi:Asp-tRNA(Asn)/Glu-tRNA(Gln) amidotransferase A subunit family amidase
MRPVAGMPVGLSIFGPAWSEELLLSVGHAFERAQAPLTMMRGIKDDSDTPAME